MGPVSPIPRRTEELGSTFALGPSCPQACPQTRGGEAEPTGSASLIRDPELRAAFLRAYHAWERSK